MLDIVSYLPPKRKQSSSGWISFNAVCCTHNGESLDRRGRGGILLTGEHDWSYHCFNCGYKTGFTFGKPLGPKTKKLLEWLGVSKKDIDHLRIESLRHRSITDIVDSRTPISANIKFNEIELPNGARPLKTSDSKFVKYIKSRGLNIDSYDYRITPDAKGRNKDRIIIPYTQNYKTVGYTSRFLDDRVPKYLNKQQEGYLFGLDFQKNDWKYVIVTEGIFDAISINGVAVMHNQINDKQAQQLRQLKHYQKEIVVVPDNDKAGLKLVDDAVKNEFSVSFPEWDEGIKDVNDAVIKYGKIVTLLKIIKGIKSSSIKIKLARKKMENNL